MFYCQAGAGSISVAIVTILQAVPLRRCGLVARARDCCLFQNVHIRSGTHGLATRGYFSEDQVT